STPVQPGNSGGALVDMSGSVVGVVVAQLNAVAKSVPQNVNFAIQPSFVMNFLSVKGAPPKYSSSTGTRKPPHEDCDIAKKLTIQVYCQGISRKTATGSAGPLALSPSDVADFGTKFDVQATPEQGSTRPKRHPPDGGVALIPTSPTTSSLPPETIGVQ